MNEAITIFVGVFCAGLFVIGARMAFTRRDGGWDRKNSEGAKYMAAALVVGVLLFLYGGAVIYNEDIVVVRLKFPH